LTGTVTLVEDRVDPKTDMGPVDISLPAEARLRPGQFVRVRIITEERRDCLTVPSRSIVKNQSGEWVIYLVSGKQAIQQPVKVGFREGDMVQVHSLILQPGDKVVTTGAYGLPEKTKIRILSE
jgi:multidrug efflux pump subunit AcrA (membrane-fusion protein)